MSAFKKLIASLLFATISTSAFAVTNAQVFAYAAANYPSLFPGTATAGQYQQYDYRYYASSKNYLAVDPSGTIFVLGPVSNNAITSVGTASALANTITAWEATQGGTTPVAGMLMGGASRGAPLNLTAAVTTVTGNGVATGGLGGGVTSDGSNLYWIYNDTIKKMVIATGAVTTLAGGGKGSADGTGTAASFNQPAGVTTDGTNLYVTDSSNQKIRKIVIATGVVATLAGSGVYTTTPVDGTGAAATFFYPKGITTDGSYVYVQDVVKLRKIEIATGVVTSLGNKPGGTGNGQGVTTDGSNLYEVWGNQVFKRVLATGVVTALAGDTNDNGGSANGTGTAAFFKNPSGITTDGTNLYVSDYANNQIRKIVIASGVVTTLAGSGTTGSSDGTGTAASFQYPNGITTDGRNLYVSEYGSGKIRKIQ